MKQKAAILPVLSFCFCHFQIQQTRALAAAAIDAASARKEKMSMIRTFLPRDAGRRNGHHSFENVRRDLIGTPQENCVDAFSSNFYSASAFMYYEESNKDFSSYYSTIYEGSTFIGEYKDLLEYYKAPCEYFGGTLYSITGTQNCTGDDPVMLNIDSNFPFCALNGCSVDKSSVEESEMFQFCSNQELADKDYEVKEVKLDLLSTKCKDQLQSFSSEVPTHPLTFEEVNVDEFDVSGNGTQFNFDSILDDFKAKCEAEGGYLYTFSDSVKGPGEEYTLFNYPVCLGSSCDAKVYFEELYAPTMEFEFAGNFRDEVTDIVSGNTTYLGNKTYPIQRTYDFFGFEALSEIPSSSDSPDTDVEAPENEATSAAGKTMMDPISLSLSMIFVGVISSITLI